MSEPTTIGLSDATQKKLQELIAENLFDDQVDAYRFAISLALATGKIADDHLVGKSTIFNIGTLDPDRNIKTAIRIILKPPPEESIYKLAQRLAEWGVKELYRLYTTTGDIPFLDLLMESQTLMGKD